MTSRFTDFIEELVFPAMRLYDELVFLHRLRIVCSQVPPAKWLRWCLVCGCGHWLFSSMWGRTSSSLEAPLAASRRSREMAMAYWAWLHVSQQLYRIMAPAGVIIPGPLGGAPGRQVQACLSSPSGHELSTKWLAREPSGPRAASARVRGLGACRDGSPSLPRVTYGLIRHAQAKGSQTEGREHKRARFDVKRRLGANPRTGFWHVSRCLRSAQYGSLVRVLPRR